MSVAIRHGESGGFTISPFPSHRVLLVGVALALALLALGWPRTACAEALYRCAGAHGATVFTSSAAGYTGCKRLSLPQQPAINAGETHRRHGRVAAGAGGSGAVHGRLTMAQGAQLTSESEAAAMERAGKRVLRGAVYRVVRADGSVEYTNVRPSRQHARSVQTLFTYVAACPACDVHSPINWRTVPLNMTAYARTVRSAATEFGVSVALLRAIIHAESAFNPRALSDKGAQGLMQLMPGTASDLGVSDAFDAVQNIRGGAHYLADLLKTFDGNVRLAAAAYNAGPAAVRRYGGVPPYDQTQVYVDRVEILRKRYAAAQSATSLAASGGPAG